MKRNLALVLAILVDATQWFVTPFFALFGIGYVLDVALDIFMAIALIVLRGFHWVYLPTFIAEMIPGANLVPFWTVAVLLTWKKNNSISTPAEKSQTSAIEVSSPNQILKPTTIEKPQTMNPRNIFAVVLSLGIVIVAVIVALPAGRLIGLPTDIVDRTLAAAKGLFGDKITSTTQTDGLEIKPITELALARVRIRSIVTYQNSSWGSSKMIIADQAFDVRLGWDLESDVKIEIGSDKKTAHILASKPKLLTISHAVGQAAPNTLYSSNGLFNKLTPEDQNEVIKELEAAVPKDPSINDGLATAKKQFEDYFRGIFIAQGLDCSFEYK